MKNFVKHIFAVAICAAALLSSCIKEEEYIRSTAELSVSLTGIEDTRSETQGNLIQDAWIWAYQCTIDETHNTIAIDNDAVPVGSRYVYGLNSYDNISVHLPLPACSETDGTPVPQSYLLVAVINTKAYGELKLSANSTWRTIKNATFAPPATFWSSYPKENAPEVMPISNWTTLTITNADTHSDNCYALNLPVYRAVAKTQLYMAKTGDFDLQVLDAQVVATTEYSQGMLLTGNRNSSVLDANGNPTSEVLRGDNGEKVYQGLPSEAADPWWWDASPDVKTSDKGYQLKNSESGFTTATIETLGSATNPQSGEFTWVASTFLLENDNEAAYGVGAYDTPQGPGYNLRVTYKVGEGEPVVVYTPLGKVARNHDYKVYATVNAGGEMIFNIVVNEWLVEEQVLNYQDIATVTTDGHIKWSNLPKVAGQNIINESSGQVESGIINLTPAKGSSATFTFTLATPVTGYWIAELRTVMGDAGDIVFDDGSADGKTVLEGPIDNIENEITIKNLSDNLAQSGGVENRVTLHIYAKAYWGDVLRSYRVDGIVGPGMTTDYTIVQPTQ